jgi:uncharacterized membrane protein
MELISITAIIALTVILSVEIIVKNGFRENQEDKENLYCVVAFTPFPTGGFNIISKIMRISKKSLTIDPNLKEIEEILAKHIAEDSNIPAEKLTISILSINKL